MPTDKSWIFSPQYNNEYANGLNIFLEFAFAHANGLVIKCPCSKCHLELILVLLLRRLQQD